MKHKHAAPLSAITAALAVSLLTAGEANGFDQAQSQEQARQTHNNGSDDSLKHSYRNALTAVSNFFDLNIPGAITYGVKAYGQYKNSQQMDDLRDKNKHLEGTMATAGGQIIGGAAGAEAGVAANVQNTITGSASESPFRRIDPKFLRDDAETAEVASRVETITGMSREKMFQVATAIQEKNMNRSMNDSDIVTKAKLAYREFMGQIPNQDFKNGMAKAENIVSMKPAQEVLAKFRAVDDEAAASMVAKADASSTIQTQAAPAATSSNAATEPPTVAATSPAAAPPPAAALATAEPGKADLTGLADAAAFSARGAVNPSGDPRLLGLERTSFDPVDGFLGDLEKTHREEEEGKTIFKIVSTKLRDMNFRQDLERKRDHPVVITKIADMQ